jgi:hypothetical protein
MNFVNYVRLYARMYNRCSRENFMLGTYMKNSFTKVQIWVKSSKNIGDFA